jgi:hypothetical protein
MGAASPGSDPRQIRELLAAAQGYAVLEREGRRVGEFIELAGPGADQIAIRDDGVLLWRRRLLPITTVASVFPEQRAILLNVDRRLLAAPDELARAAQAVEEGADVSGEWQERIARYASPNESDAEQVNADAVSTPSTESAEPERTPTVAHQPAPEPAQPDERTPARHLLFVSTARGYALVEQEGPPPPLGRRIEVPAETNSFRVAKLGPSPLPNDRRICAYLEQTD